MPFSYPFEPIKESLGDAGFAGITARVLKRTKQVPDTAAFARGMIRGNDVVVTMGAGNINAISHGLPALLAQQVRA